MAGGSGEGLAIAEGGRVHALADGAVLRIGRGAECEIWLDSPAVSRLHAEISAAHGALVVKDLASRNGVFVNGERISGETRLRLGDKVRIGDRVLAVVSLARTRLKTEPRSEERPTLLVARKTGSMNAYAIELDTLRNALAQGRTVAAKASAGRLCEALGGVVDVAAFDRSILERVCAALLRLAEQADDALWLDELLRVHAHLAAPLEVRTADAVATLIETLPPARDSGRTRYTIWSRAQPLRFSERAALKRLIDARSRRG